MRHLREIEHEMLVCTRCNYCAVNAPVMKVLGWESSGPRGRIVLAYGMVEGEIGAEDVAEAMYQCTLCGACEVECPSKVAVLDVIEAARRDLFEGGKAPEHLYALAEKAKKGNIYSSKEPLQPPKSRIVYFMGCASANSGLGQTVLTLLSKLEVKVAALENACCGAPLLHAGDTKGFMEIAERNLQILKNASAEEVIFSCPIGYHTFKERYPEHGLMVRFILDIIADKVQNLRPFPEEIRIAYHDPCYLGRHENCYILPREILSGIKNVKLLEFKKSRERSECCGGLLSLTYPEIAEKIAKNRLEGMEAELIVTSCPFGTEIMQRLSHIEVKDICEVLLERLG